VNISAVIFFLIFVFVWAGFSYLALNRIRAVRYKGDRSITALTIYIVAATLIVVSTLLALT
jgi:hypothetical protein